MNPPDPLAAAEFSARLLEAGATLRHDLRNRLTAIKNASFYLKRRSEKAPLWQEDKRLATFFGLIDSELVEAEKLLLDLTGPSILFEGTPRLLDPVSCVQRALDLARVEPAKRLDFEHRFVPAGALLSADPDELAVAIRCLLENAAEASPDGGSVVVRTSVENADLVVEITDQGPGLTAEARAAAFRPFFTTRPGHAGLGLPIAQRAARKHAGTVSFADTPPGACVRMTLRLQRGAAGA